MAKSQKSKANKWQKHRKLIWLIGLPVGALIIILALFFRVNTSLQLSISPALDEYPDSRYANFKVTLKNNGEQPVDSPFGTCAERSEYSIDGIRLTPPRSWHGAVCAIGYGSVYPGKSRTRSVKLNLRGLPEGNHMFSYASGRYELARFAKVKWYGNIAAKSTFKIKDVADTKCYGFTAYESTNCDQITIKSGAGTYGHSRQQAMALCKRIKTKYFTNRTYQPITTVGTSKCKWWETELVFNVPPKDTKKVLKDIQSRLGFSVIAVVTGEAILDQRLYSKEWLQHLNQK